MDDDRKQELLGPTRRSGRELVLHRERNVHQAHCGAIIIQHRAALGKHCPYTKESENSSGKRARRKGICSTLLDRRMCKLVAFTLQIDELGKVSSYRGNFLSRDSDFLPSKLYFNFLDAGHRKVL